jgi:hypothetical protein
MENKEELYMEGKRNDDEGETVDTLLKGDATRFVDYSFGNVLTQGLTVSGELMLTGIAMGNPVEGGTVKIPNKVSVVIIQNLYPYTQLTFTMPVQPEYGRVISIVSTVDIANLSFINGSFTTKKPTSMSASVPLRFIFAGSWFNI